MRCIAAGAAVLALLMTAPAVHAEPPVPQADTACGPSLAGTLTRLPDLETVLQCTDEPALGYRWEHFDDPYPHSDTWFTYGPVLTLHGEGQRNREVDSGEWSGYPQDPDSRCAAKQTAIAPAGGVTEPDVATGELGFPLRVQLLPLLFTLELSGHCIWQKG